MKGISGSKENLFPRFPLVHAVTDLSVIFAGLEKHFPTGIPEWLGYLKTKIKVKQNWISYTTMVIQIFSKFILKKTSLA